MIRSEQVLLDNGGETGLSQPEAEVYKRLTHFKILELDKLSYTLCICIQLLFKCVTMSFSNILLVAMCLRDGRQSSFKNCFLHVYMFILVEQLY